jgi:Spy/CpxP family protein refolding chaperone
MSEENTDTGSTCTGNRKHGMGRRTRLVVAAVTLVGVGALLGAGVTAQAARGGFHGMGHHWSHPKTEEQAKERALDKTAWMLGRVDASEEQQARINDIVTSLVGELYPLRGEHRETRRELITELSRPQVDREALEKIRAEGLLMADSASRVLVDAVVEVSEVLTVEQRQELASMIGRHRH